MATWPTTLPEPKLSGYKLTPNDPVIRTEMEGGNSRARRRTTARLDKFAVSFDFNQAQMATFRSWFDDATGANGGASWFAITIMTGDGADVTVDARMTFNGADYIGKGTWVVTGQFEVRYA